jgi:hypothetical protein
MKIKDILIQYPWGKAKSNINKTGVKNINWTALPMFFAAVDLFDNLMPGAVNRVGLAAQQAARRGKSLLPS